MATFAGVEKVEVTVHAKSVHRRRKHAATRSKSILRMVPPFVTAHLGIFRFLKEFAH